MKNILETINGGDVVSSSDSPAPIDIPDSDIKTCIKTCEELQKFIDGFNGSTETEKLDYSKSQARIKKDIREKEKKEKIEKEISKKVKKLILMIEKHHNLLKMKGSGSIENDEDELDIIEKNKKRLQKMSVAIENDEEELDTSKDLAEHAIPKTLEL